MKENQVPVKEGYGQDSGGLSKTKTYERTEQDGQNKLRDANQLYRREELTGNE